MHNEDNFIVCPDLREKRWYLADQPGELSAPGSLLVVADGMGGANAGEVASEIAVEVIRKRFNALEIGEDIEEEQVRDFLYQVIMEAHKAILEVSARQPECMGMGTTILIAWVFPQKATIAWVGDSRAYLHRKKEGLKLLTKDHSLVWELVEAGKLTPEEADIHPDNNIITQSLGDQSQTPQPEFVSYKLEQADRLLLCSDGLNNLLSHKAIEAILEAESSFAEANVKLVQTANENGGTDNITVLSLEVLQVPTTPAAKERNKKGYWALVILGMLCLVGGLLIYLNRAGTFFSDWGQEPVGMFENKSVMKSSPPEAVATTSSEKQNFTLKGEEEPKLLSSDRIILEEQYRNLDSVFKSRFPNRSLNALGKYNATLFAEVRKGNAPKGETEKELKELLYLVQKYQLGYPEQYRTEQAFQHFLAGQQTPAIEGISTELSRIDVLINKLKPE